jgi:flagellar biosynthetic protein FliR
MLVGGEVMAGVAIGFAVQIGFSAALLAGETISNAMGLGFAGMVDPQTGQQNPMLGQFLTILATFLFLAIGGHLALAATIVESYRALPPGDAWLSAGSINGLVLFGGVLFAAGLSIALPVGFALILVQLVMGMLARSAPQLNLFSVGLPADPAGRHRPARHCGADDRRRHHRRPGAGLEEARGIALGR